MTRRGWLMTLLALLTTIIASAAGWVGDSAQARQTAVYVYDADFVIAAEDGLTVAGERATIHGAERLNQAGFDEETVAATKSGFVTRQADGATVYVNEVSPGRYDFIVEGDNGVVTAHRGWSFKSVTRLTNNYGWEGWPP